MSISWHLNGFHREAPWLITVQWSDNQPINLSIIAQWVQSIIHNLPPSLYLSVFSPAFSTHSTLSGLTQHLSVRHKLASPPLPRRRGIPACWHHGHIASQHIWLVSKHRAKKKTNLLTWKSLHGEETIRRAEKREQLGNREKNLWIIYHMCLNMIHLKQKPTVIHNQKALNGL